MDILPDHVRRLRHAVEFDQRPNNVPRRPDHLFLPSRNPPPTLIFIPSSLAKCSAGSVENLHQSAPFSGCGACFITPAETWPASLGRLLVLHCDASTL
jgi:hypothetical protein